MKKVGERLKEIRLSMGLQQADIAELLDTSKAYISQIESGKSKLSVDNLVKLMRNYAINLNYLLDGIGEPFLTPQYEDVKAEILAEVDKVLVKYGVKNL